MEIRQRFINGVPIQKEDIPKYIITNSEAVRIFQIAQERARQGIKPVHNEVVKISPEK